MNIDVCAFMKWMGSIYHRFATLYQELVARKAQADLATPAVPMTEAAATQLKNETIQAVVQRHRHRALKAQMEVRDVACNRASRVVSRSFVCPLFSGSCRGPGI
jgi:hypothetical protein